VNWIIGGTLAVLVALTFAVQLGRAARGNQALREHRIRQALHAEAERLYPDPTGERWTGDCTACVVTWDNDADPCGIIPCPAHGGRRIGRHRAVWEIPLDDQPAGVIVQAVTSLKRRQR
jgi:hypothetical protein